QGLLASRKVGRRTLYRICAPLVGKLTRLLYCGYSSFSCWVLVLLRGPSLRLRPLACATGFASVHSLLADPLPDGELGQDGSRGWSSGSTAGTCCGSPPGSWCGRSSSNRPGSPGPSPLPRHRRTIATSCRA